MSEWKRIDLEEPTIGKQYLVLSPTGSYRVAKYIEGHPFRRRSQSYNYLVSEDDYNGWAKMDSRVMKTIEKAFCTPCVGISMKIGKVTWYMEIPDIPEPSEEDRLRMKLFEAERQVAELKRRINEQPE